MLTVQPLGPTLAAVGSVTAPTAGATIASLTAVTNGAYLVQLIAGYTGGTPAAAEINNMQLNMPGGGTIRLTLPAASAVVIHTVVVSVPSDGNLTVTAIGAGTTGVTYIAGIYAYRI